MRIYLYLGVKLSENCCATRQEYILFPASSLQVFINIRNQIGWNGDFIIVLVSVTINHKSDDTCDINLRWRKENRRKERRRGEAFSDCTIERLYDNFHLLAIFPLDCTRAIKHKRIVKGTQSTFRVTFVQFRVKSWALLNRSEKETLKKEERKRGRKRNNPIVEQN